MIALVLFMGTVVVIDNDELCFVPSFLLSAACLFRYNALSFVYLIYLLLIPLFPEPSSTTMQGKVVCLRRLRTRDDGSGFILTSFPTSPCGFLNPKQPSSRGA